MGQHSGDIAIFMLESDNKAIVLFQAFLLRSRLTPSTRSSISEGGSVG